MEYILNGKVELVGEIYEREFESLDEFINENEWLICETGECYNLHYNGIPLETGYWYMVRENREMIQEQIDRINKDYETE